MSGISGLTLQSVTTAENEFLAEETLITIQPNFDHAKLFFTSGTFGPFSSGELYDVPLWLAINLSKRNKCTIIIPDWMSVEALEQNNSNEKNLSLFEPLPFHYQEISQLLFIHAKKEIKSPDTVGALLQDIQNIRMDRAQIGLLSEYHLMSTTFDYNVVLLICAHPFSSFQLFHYLLSNRNSAICQSHNLQLHDNLVYVMLTYYFSNSVYR